jgi:hypothetical protein
VETWRPLPPARRRRRSGSSTWKQSSGERGRGGLEWLLGYARPGSREVASAPPIGSHIRYGTPRFARGCMRDRQILQPVASIDVGFCVS